MMARGQIRLNRGAVALLAASALTSPGFAQQPATVTLEPVTVTGERQSRSLQQTTSSVTVVTEQEIQRQPGRDVFDLLQGAANLTATTAVGAPVIRGLETSGAGGLPSGVTQGTLPRAPLIIDEIARPSSLANTSFTSTWDMQQFEVLRGPQSTLRGRNAIAGAFVAKTKDPTFTPEAAIQSGISFNGYDDPQHSFAGMVSGPVVKDRVAVRLTGEHQGGHVPLDIIRAPAGVSGDRQTEYDQNRVRGKILLTPDGPGGAVEVTAIGELQKGVVPANRYSVAGLPITGRSFSDRTYPYGTQGGQRVFDTTAWTIGLDGSYWMGDDRLRTITSYVRDDYKSSSRQSDTTRFDVRESLFNQDFLYNFGSKEASRSGVVGLNVGERRQSLSVSRITSVNGRSGTQAIFADGRQSLAEGLDLILGGRINRNEDDRTQTSLLTAGTLSYKKEEVTLLPKLGLSYDLDRHQTIGATARKGYNPGGGSVNFFTGRPYNFDSESVWTFEALYRSNWLADRVTLNVTGFYNLHENPQLYIQRAAGNLTSVEVVNAPNGRSYGVEVEGAAQATRDLKFTAALGLMRTEITAGLPGNASIQSNRFGRDPTLTSSLGAVWSPFEGVTLNVKVTYVSSYYSDVNNLKAEEVGNYVLGDVGASYSFSNITLRAFVDNITDKAALTRKIGSNFADLTPPRTIGLVATARF